MFFWVPLIIKFGKRPVYVAASVFFFLSVIWAALAGTYATEMVARVGIGFFSSGAECLAPLTIVDLFFVRPPFGVAARLGTAEADCLPDFGVQVHERGTYLGAYQAFLSIGVAVGSKCLLQDGPHLGPRPGSP